MGESAGIAYTAGLSHVFAHSAEREGYQCSGRAYLDWGSVFASDAG